MKVFQILFFILALSVLINAQADCGFDFRLFVKDSKGNKLNNVQIKMNLADFYYKNQTNTYDAWTLLGVGSKYKTLLQVNAKGFDKFEKEIEVECGHYSYDLRLKSKASNEIAVFEELAIISGIVKDANGGIIPNTRVILTNEKETRIETFTNDSGYYYFTTRSGKYTLEFIGTAGFKSEKHNDFDLKKGYKNFDKVLEVRPCDDCEMIEDTPIKENKTLNKI